MVIWHPISSRDHIKSCLKSYTGLASHHHKIHCDGALITREQMSLAVSTGTSQSSRAPGKAQNYLQKWPTNQPLRTPLSCSMTLCHRESTVHGWPSFRDDEVIQENVRVLADGEVVSLAGTHLGFNFPNKGNRYQINVVSVAGRPNRHND